MPQQLTLNHAYLSGFAMRVGPNAYSEAAPPIMGTPDSSAKKQRIIDGYQRGVETLCGMLLDTEDQEILQKIKEEVEQIIKKQEAERLRLLNGETENPTAEEEDKGKHLTEEELFIKQSAHAYVKLKNFESSVKEGIGTETQSAFSDDILENYLTYTAWDFDLICQLAKNETLQPSARRAEILKLTEGLGVCASGMAQNIESAARELKALKIGLPQRFVNTLTSMIEQHILGFAKQAKVIDLISHEKMSALEKKKKEESHETHFVSAFFNPVASHFNLPQRKDALTTKFDVTLLERCAKSIYSAITVDRVIQHMAEDCFTRIHDFYDIGDSNVTSTPLDPETFNTMYMQFTNILKPKLESCFGPIDYQDVFFQENLGAPYQLVNDPTLLARSIARNLRSSEQNQSVLNSFKPTTVLGEPGQNIKLKLLGDHIAYVKSTEMQTRQSLEQFVRETPESGRALLKQIEAAAANDPRAQQIQEDYWRKTLTPFADKLANATDLETFQTLIGKATSLLASNKTTTTAITEIMANALVRMSGVGNEAVVALLLNAIPAGNRANLINQTYQYGDTALTASAREGHVTITKMLAAAGATIDASYDDDCGREFRLAAQEGLEGKVRAWLAAGVKVDQMDEKRITPLMLAANKGHPNIVKILLAAGAKVNHEDNERDTPLTVTASKGHTDILGMLLAAGAKVNHMNDDGSTALMLAAGENHPAAVRLLLEAKADVNQTNTKGATALIRAACEGHPNTLQLLLVAGANVLHVNKGGRTALSCAKLLEKMHIVPILQAAEARAKAEAKRASSGCSIT